MQPLPDRSCALRLLLVGWLLACVCCGLPGAEGACSGSVAVQVNSSAWGRHRAANRDQEGSGFLHLFPLSLPAAAQGGSFSQLSIQFEGDKCSGSSSCPTANTRWAVYALSSGQYTQLSETHNYAYDPRSGQANQPYVVTLALGSTVTAPSSASTLWVAVAADSSFGTYETDTKQESLSMSFTYDRSSGLPGSIPASSLGSGGLYTLAFQLLGCAADCTDIPSAAFSNPSSNDIGSQGAGELFLWPLPIPHAARGQRLSELVVRYYGEAASQAYVRWAVYRQLSSGDYKRLEQTAEYNYPGGSSHTNSGFDVRLQLKAAVTVANSEDTLYVAAAASSNYYVYNAATSTPALSTSFTYAQGDSLPASIASSSLSQAADFTVSFELVTCADPA